MQNQMRERAVAMQVASLQTSFVNAFLQVAKARDLFYWLGSFYVLAGLGMVAGFSRCNIFNTSFTFQLELEFV